MIDPGQTMEEYLDEIANMDHVAYHAAQRKEIEEKMAKLGWCLTNHHHICPRTVKSQDDKVPACACKCHEEEITQEEGWDLI